MKFISIRGARTHNLKNINLTLPRNKLIVITGLSGSGKSSLAFDTLYAEGQRRYVESLSTYARQFLSMMEKPDVDLIEGLSPAISIEQKTTSHNPRSTVGTITEIYDYCRLLFARVGEPQCPVHGNILEAQTISQIVDNILTLPEQEKIAILAPIVKNRKGEHAQLIKKLASQGFLRLRINAEIYEIQDIPALAPQKKHNIEVVVDRLTINQSQQTRLADSLATALELSLGTVQILKLNSQEILTFSSKFACGDCGYSIDNLEPRMFSFNNPAGACAECNGLGVEQIMDPDKIVSNPELSIAAGAIRGWDKNNIYFFALIKSLSKHYDFNVSTPFKNLPKTIQDILLYGSGDELINFTYVDKKQAVQHAFEGIIPCIQRRYENLNTPHLREELGKFLTTRACPHCHGSRINTAARHVFINNNNLPSIMSLSIKEALQFCEKLTLSGWKVKVADKILKEINARLQFLLNVGLDYLSLNRTADTLSGGEAQRIRLASQIGAGLVGVLYVLDEPSIGLHQRDNDRLLQTLTTLRDLGNTVVVVEHDEDAILQADYVVDIGPGAGVHGGHIVASGTPQEIIKSKDSLTGKYLSKKLAIEIPNPRKKPDDRLITLTGANSNNLQNITASFPIGLITCVTGVSGSGKSTLINHTLYPIAAQKLNGTQSLNIGKYSTISGLEYLDKVVDISQSPIGRTPRSNPATYTGMFTDIRELFAGTAEARSRGYSAGRFSFNVKGGRCEACRGDGVIKVEMHFLADVFVTCDVCNGKRYNRETLEIYYKNKNIDDVLNMTVETALQFFQAIPALARKLETLTEVGLNYITLGQNATTLSGGEAQRIKLSKELSRRDTGKTLYILDEPTTGLHFADIAKLLKVLQQLNSRGNTIIIIEHNLDIIKAADWIIDIGPEGGDKGGNIIAHGSPEKICNNKDSYTGKFLKKILEAHVGT